MIDEIAVIIEDITPTEFEGWLRVLIDKNTYTSQAGGRSASTME